MIKMGQHHRLRVSKIVPPGLLLNGHNYGDVLLPKKHAPKNLSKGDEVDVFLYLDSEDLPIATTQQPKVCVGQFAYLKAIDSNKYGTFFDWGLDKDLLVPFGEQHRPLEVGKSYLLYVYIDKVDSRITGSTKIDKFLDYEKPHSYKVGDTVKLIIANSTDLGLKAIVDHGHWGMLYKNEVHQTLSFGQSIGGFIKSVRPDGRIDLSLQFGQESRDKDEQKILDYLNANHGLSDINDKSEPQLIADIFGISKGAFKKAVGRLYKKREIRLENNQIIKND